MFFSILVFVSQEIKPRAGLHECQGRTPPPAQEQGFEPRQFDSRISAFKYHAILSQDHHDISDLLQKEQILEKIRPQYIMKYTDVYQKQKHQSLNVLSSLKSRIPMFQEVASFSTMKSLEKCKPIKSPQNPFWEYIKFLFKKENCRSHRTLNAYETEAHPCRALGIHSSHPNPGSRQAREISTSVSRLQIFLGSYKKTKESKSEH